jgi:hypothetical protein
VTSEGKDSTSEQGCQEPGKAQEQVRERGDPSPAERVSSTAPFLHNFFEPLSRRCELTLGGVNPFPANALGHDIGLTLQ